MLDLTPPLAVVPILVNAGAALLPALVAALASVVTLLLKPRELIAACRRHPRRALGVTIGAFALVAVVLLWPAGETDAAPTTRRAAGAATNTDWTKVALEIIRAEQRQQELAGSAVVAVSPPTTSATGGADDSRTSAAPTRTGFAGGPAPIGLKPLWEHEEEFAMFLSSPVAVGDRVYATWCLLDPPKSFGAVVCLDAATGRLLWLVDERADGEPFKGIFSSPAVSADGRYLVVGQGLHPDANCDLICIDTGTGRVKWTLPTPLHIESSPAIAGGLVIAGAGAIEVGDDHRPSGDPGYVFAVDLETGREIWRHAVADPESSPAIVDGIAYIGSGFNGNAVVALRIDTDETLAAEKRPRELWRQHTPHPATGAITVAGDLVLVGCGNGDFVFAARNPAGAVLAFDRLTGEKRWEAALPDSVLGTIAVRGRVAICPVRNGEVVALDLARDGAVLWRSAIHGKTPVLAGPAVSEELVYAVSSDGTLAVLELATGTLVERHYLNAPGKPGELGMSLSAPFVSGGRVFVGSETGGLRCFIGSGSRR